MSKLEMFLEDCRAHGCAESTIREYQRRLERTDVVLKSAGKSLETATVEDFIDLIRQMSKAGLRPHIVAAAARSWCVFSKRTRAIGWGRLIPYFTAAIPIAA